MTYDDDAAHADGIRAAGEQAGDVTAEDAADQVEQADATDEQAPVFSAHDFPGGVRSVVEAILMVVDQPVSVAELAEPLLLDPAEIELCLQELEAEYAKQNRGFTLREINGAWRIFSRPAYAAAVEKFLMDGQQAKLTQASLETLAVIAYRQPVSRSRVSAVRGVNVDGVVRTLLTRGLIAEVGQESEGGAMLYGTTSFFLQRLGLSSLDELPALAPYLPDPDVIDELIEQGHG